MFSNKIGKYFILSCRKNLLDEVDLIMTSLNDLHDDNNEITRV